MRKILALGTAVAALAGTARPAAACGGCFVPPSENTVVVGHRMAVAVSMTQSVLWDQIQYAGDPAEFSWVLPVRPGARIELADDAWFEVLDDATNLTVTAPPQNCSSGGSSGFGCGSSNKSSKGSVDFRSAPEVTVLHQETVGPYETVTLQSKIPGALDTWLGNHGYTVPPDVKPIIAAYVKEGFDFIALKLVPGNGVSTMRPVRVVTPGAGFGLPLRMVGAGTGASTAIKLFVIAEGRYQTKNFAHALLPREEIRWDFDTSSSNYAVLREQALAQNGGKAFLTAYAEQGALLATTNGASYANVYYDGASSIGGRYFQQAERDSPALIGNATSAGACGQRVEGLAGSLDLVVADCDAQGTCKQPGPGKIGASQFACGQIDDLAVALTGMHPHDVWVTRLEASLPRAALATDLMLEAAADQGSLSNRVQAPRWINNPCDFDNASVGTWPGGLSRSTRPGPDPLPGGIVATALAMAAMAAFARRMALARAGAQ